MLVDSFGRVIDYLRVSVTDRCNLRCVYCMPAGGVEWKPHDSMLTLEETLRVCGIMAELGIRKIKVTGGEPLVRRGTAVFLKHLKALPGMEQVTLTTNGLLLGAYLDEAESLLPGSLPDGVNISLDALDPARSGNITREEHARPGDILAHAGRLLEKRVPVKINCVPVRGYNEDEIVPLAALAKDRNIAVRFIELMPLGPGADMKAVSGGETKALLEKAFGALTPFPAGKPDSTMPAPEEDGGKSHAKSTAAGGGAAASSPVPGNGPAVYYTVSGFAGKIGFINPVSHGFCETCNRLRLTSEGVLKPCLSSPGGTDLRELLRGGAGNAEIAGAVKKTAAEKPHFHNFSGIYGKKTPEYETPHSGGMFGIGG